MVKKRKGKEYDFGELIFEGENLNGERNGKGKEYDYKDNLEFEDEYIYSKKYKGKVIIRVKYNFKVNLKIEKIQL